MNVLPFNRCQKVVTQISERVDVIDYVTKFDTGSNNKSNYIKIYTECRHKSWSPNKDSFNSPYFFLLCLKVMKTKY